MVESMTQSVKLLKEIISLKSGGEERKEQEVAVEEIEKALKTETNLLLEAPTGSGKALCVDTPVLTVNGWSTMGELKVGDYVYGTNGFPTRVTHVHDAFHSSQTFALTFSSGETIYADKEHLWNFLRINSQLPDSKTQRDSVEIDETRQQKIKEVEIYVTKEYQLLPSSDVSLEDTSIYSLFSTLHPNIPEELIHKAAYHSKPLLETDEAVYYSQYELLEQVYIEFLNREHTWTTEEFYAAFKRDRDEGLHNNISYVVERAKPLHYEASKLPVPSLFFGEWLAGFENLFTVAQFKRLEEAGITTNDGIPDIYKQAEPRHREFLLRGLLREQKNNVFRTSIKRLAEDVKFVANSLGYHSAVHASETEDGQTIHSVIIAYDLAKREFVDDIQIVESREVRCITVDADDHLFLVGKTLLPTHNTLSYLIPLVTQGTRAVISTATIQLSEQIMREDVVFLNKALKDLGTQKKANVTLLKGRDNYLCLAKFEENRRIADNENTLFGTEDAMGEVNAKANAIGQQVSAISKWADETETGDRTDAPAVTDDIWRQFSSNNVECPGKSACPFGEECFAELARAKAAKSPIVVTNHAIVAADLATEGKLLDQRDTFIFDELHELDNYMSKAWGAELTHRSIQNAVKLFKNIPSLKTELYEELKDLSDKYKAAVTSVGVGLLEDGDMSIKLTNYISQLFSTTTKLVANLTRLEKEASSDSMKRIYNSSKKVATELRDTAERLSDSSIQNVRWTEDLTPREEWQPPSKRRTRVKNVDPATSNMCNIVLKAAPLRIGPKLQSFLTDRESTMIGLSATITVGGSMSIPLHTFGLEDKKHHTVVLDTPYDYTKQAMLYIPSDDFPLPVGQERNDHIEAVKKSSTKFIKAAGGRALVLSTTTSNAKAYGNHYKKALDNNILLQGDAPNSQLISQFKEEYNSSLVGTMGFWHGLDAPGSTCILVVIDKLPFPSPSDPLLLARKNYADKMGRNGFNEIYGTIADWMARQGMGRGVRSRSDRVVIAFYDRRLLTKNYGRAIVHNMYGIGVYRDEEQVLKAVGRLAAMSEEQEKEKLKP